MTLTDAAKRLCIYSIYDKDGIVDDYIIYQLKDLKKNVAFLHCVINGTLTKDSRKKLEIVADEIFERENKGIDIGAHKEAVEHIGWDIISKYDELILMNNTCFGPVYPFKEVFDWAEKLDIDLWGLTWGNKTEWFGTDEYLHFNKKATHIQSYFLALRKPLLGSKFLIKFFDEIPNDANYIMAASVFEYAFPGYFEEQGYKSAVYCDDKDDLNYPLLHNPIYLLKQYRMPLFKKRSFFHHYTDVINNGGGQATYELIKYIENETDYDISLVWESMLRISSLSDLVRCAQLNRILSSNVVIKNITNSLKLGVIFYLFYDDIFAESVEYLKNFPAGTDILITTNTKEKKNLIQKYLERLYIKAEILVISNRGRDISALLVGGADFVKKHDLICFAHDKKVIEFKPEGVGRSWRYKLYQNMFATKEYVENIIGTFESEPHLGIAFPSMPNHHQYAYNIGNGWLGNFHNTDKLLNDFGVKVKRNEHTLCVAPLGTCFWFRSKALEKLFAGYDGDGWRYEDFPYEPIKNDKTILQAIERAYAYFAQDVGYYPAYIYNSEFTSIELTNLEFFKVGSGDMRAWVEKLAMQGIGYVVDSPDNYTPMFGQDIQTLQGSEQVSQLFINDGTGYSEEKKIIAVNSILEENEFSIRFDISGYPKIKELRFDPIEGHFCQVEIVSAVTSGGNIKMIPGAAVRNGNVDIFLNTDPQYFISSSCSEFLEIKFKLQLLSNFAAEQNVRDYVQYQNVISQSYLQDIEQKNIIIDTQTKNLNEQGLLIEGQATKLNEQSLIIENQTTKLNEQCSIIEGQTAKLNEQGSIIETQTVEINEQSVVIKKQLSEIETKDNKISTLLENVNEKVNVIEALQQQFEQVTNELNSLYNSRSWRITTPLRAVFTFFRKNFKKEKQL